MEKKVWIAVNILAVWLLSLVITTQCAIRETHLRHATEWHTCAEEASSISKFPSTLNPNTPLKAFEGDFKRGLTAP